MVESVTFLVNDGLGYSAEPPREKNTDDFSSIIRKSRIGRTLRVCVCVWGGYNFSEQNGLPLFSQLVFIRDLRVRVYPVRSRTQSKLPPNEHYTTTRERALQ